jgi:F0F1-type ATP synthase assembly protein I
VKHPGSQPQSNPDLLVMAARYMALGLQMAFSVLVGFGIGYLIDRVLHTRPWFMVVFAILGMGAASFSVYRAVRDFRETSARPPKDRP